MNNNDFLFKNGLALKLKSYFRCILYDVSNLGFLLRRHQEILLIQSKRFLQLFICSFGKTNGISFFVVVVARFVEKRVFGLFHILKMKETKRKIQKTYTRKIKNNVKF